MPLDSNIPSGPLAAKWDKHKFDLKLINPANKRKFDIIVVGSGLAGASAAASLAELGYKVKCFCFQDSPRRAHSIAAQGGINAAKNYQNDGDSVYRLFYDTIKGGDFRAREANVYRLAQVSGNIIDQCVAQGVPFAREYGGLLANRSFGGAQVSRTFYARGQTGQQLLLGAYQALCRQIPLLIVGPAVVSQPSRVGQLGCSLDVAPTLLGLVGRPYRSTFFGQDLLHSNTNNGRALLNHNRDIGLLARERLVVLGLMKHEEFYAAGAPHQEMKPLHSPESLERELQLDAMALFQVADDLYMHQRYRVETNTPADTPTSVSSSRHSQP